MVELLDSPGAELAADTALVTAVVDAYREIRDAPAGIPSPR
jgi:hypothetical protein